MRPRQLLHADWPQILGLSTLATSGAPSTTEPAGASKGLGCDSDRGPDTGGRQQLFQLQPLGTPSGSLSVGLGGGAVGGAGLEGPLLGPGTEGLDRGMYSSVLRAFRALEACAVEGDHMLSQVGAQGKGKSWQWCTRARTFVCLCVCVCARCRGCGCCVGWWWSECTRRTARAHTFVGSCRSR